MFIKKIGSQIIADVKIYGYPIISRVAVKAVGELLDIASISSRSQLRDWASSKVNALKRHLPLFSEAEKIADKAGFVEGVEEARAAVKALKGHLEKKDGDDRFAGKFKVFMGASSAYASRKTAYINFVVFLSGVGKGNIFSSADFSPATMNLFKRAMKDNLIKAIVNGSHASTWAVFKDPMLFLQERVERLSFTLRKILSYS